MTSVLIMSQIQDQYPNEPERWIQADKTRDVQDEYLEWTLQKNDQGQIVGVTFTCEGPEVSFGTLLQSPPANSYSIGNFSLNAT